MGRVWKCLEGFSQKVAQPPFGHEGFLNRYVNPEWFLSHPFGSLGMDHMDQMTWHTHFRKGPWTKRHGLVWDPLDIIAKDMS